MLSDRMKKVLVAALACAALALALGGVVGCGPSAKAEASGGAMLRVGVRATIPGFGYLNEDTGRYSGLEIDLADELARRLGYDGVTFVSVMPETREETLQSGQVDCVIACYSVSPERQEAFDFSPSYYDDTSVIMVENSSLVTSVEQLEGQTVGVVTGSDAVSELVDKLVAEGMSSGVPVSQTSDGAVVQYDTFTLVQAESYRELNRLLEVGSVDAVCMDGSIAHAYKDASRTVLDFSVSVQYYGVATQKGSELSQPVADAVSAMIDDGTVAALMDKWN